MNRWSTGNNVICALMATMSVPADAAAVCVDIFDNLWRIVCSRIFRCLEIECGLRVSES